MDNAELYSSANGMQKKDAREILAEFRNKIRWKRDGRILDVGCGSGEVTAEIILPLLPEDFRELVGLDVSSDMIEHARNLHSHFKMKFVQFDISQSSDNILNAIRETRTSTTRKGAKEEESASDEGEIEVSAEGDDVETDENFAFDIIFSFYCLHWVSNQKSALKNIYKCLKPGGEALLTFLVRSPIFTLYKELSKATLWKEYMQDVDHFIPLYQNSESPGKIFGDLLQTTGFAVLYLDCRKKQYVFESFSSLRDAIVAVNPFLSRIPKVLRDDFIEECLYQAEIHNLAAYKNNGYRVTYKLMVAHIRKPDFE